MFAVFSDVAVHWLHEPTKSAEEFKGISERTTGIVSSLSLSFFPQAIVSGRIKKVDGGTDASGFHLKFCDQYGNQFMDSAFMKYAIIRTSDSQIILENVTWIDGRMDYKIRDQIPPGDYSIKLQFKESGETALGSEVTLPFRL